VPVWTSISDKLLNTIESVQLTNCIKRILEPKFIAHRLQLKLLVELFLSGFIVRYLCTREQLRIMTLDNCHPLAEQCKTSVRKGIRFSPAEFLQVMSKQLQHAISGYTVENRQVCSLDNIIFPFHITVIDIPTRDSEIANNFIRRHAGSSLLFYF